MTHYSSILLATALVSGLTLATVTAKATIATPDTGSCVASQGVCLQITNTAGGGTALQGKGTSNATGVNGSSVTGNGVFGFSSSSTGVYGSSTTGTGTYGITTSANNFGVAGTNFGTSGYGGAAVYGDSNFSAIVWAGRFDGDTTANDVYGINFYTTSDRRLKKDIKDSLYGLNEVSKLHPVTFKWLRSNSDRIQLGFIAQEVQAIVPEAVVARGPDAQLGINYNALMPMAIKAIQEQQKIIDAQSARIARLEQRRSNSVAAMLSDSPSATLALLLAAGAGIVFHRRSRASVPTNN